MPSKPPSPLQLVGIGSTIALTVAGGLILGWLVDERADTLPVFTLTGLAAGMAVAGGHLYSVIRKFMQD